MSQNESRCPYHSSLDNPGEDNAQVLMSKKEKLSDEWLDTIPSDIARLCIFMEEFKIASCDDIISLVNEKKRNEHGGKMFQQILAHPLELRVGSMNVGDLFYMGLLGDFLVNLIKLDFGIYLIDILSTKSYFENANYQQLREIFRLMSMICAIAKKLVNKIAMKNHSNDWDQYDLNSIPHESIGFWILKMNELLEKVKIICPLAVCVNDYQSKLHTFLLQEIQSGISNINQHRVNYQNELITDLIVSNEGEEWVVKNSDGIVMFQNLTHLHRTPRYIKDDKGRRFRNIGHCPFFAKMKEDFINR